MTWNDVLISIVSGLVGLAFTVTSVLLVPMLVTWLKSKTKNEVLKNALDRAGKIIIDAANTTTQTYVEGLKKAGKFDAEAQKVAFQMTMDAVLKLLNEETKQAIMDTYGDLNAWLKTAIESAVFEAKK